MAKAQPSTLMLPTMTGILKGEAKTVEKSTPSPADFEKFIPWVCLQYCMPAVVTVARVQDDKNVKKWFGSAPARGKSPSRDSNTPTPKPEPKKESVVRSGEHFNLTRDTFVPLQCVYNRSGNLVELIIDNYPRTLNIQLIKAIGMSLPFHKLLTKLTFTKIALNANTVHKISTLLVDSNITEVCFDNSSFPEANYYVMLDHPSKLKYLSLCQCEINDDIIKMIADRLEHGKPAAKSLQILSLSRNHITDTGMKYLGNILRTNRKLLHINLAGNRITDAGFYYVTNHLKEFSLTSDEILDWKTKRMKFMLKNQNVYEKCFADVKTRRQEEQDSIVTPGGTSNQRGKTLSQKSNKMVPKGKRKKEQESLALVDKEPIMTLPNSAVAMTKTIAEDYDGSFDSKELIVRDGYTYCKGNFTLCSINMAYNQLNYVSLKRISEVLHYQNSLETTPPLMGLIRIVMDGNFVPKACEVLEDIKSYLRQKVSKMPAGRRASSKS